MSVLVLLFDALFVFCVCYAIVSDFKHRLIPNWIPLVLVVAFIVFAPLRMSFSGILLHLAIAGIVFAVAWGLSFAGWITDGDVKLLATVMLWMGPDHAVAFVLLTALFAGLLALALMGLRMYGSDVRARLPASRLLDRLTALADSRQVPYGVAIGLAALLMANNIFRL